MGIVEIIGLAASISLLAGWRLYLCVVAVGIAMRLDWLAAPTHLASLAALESSWVIGAAAVMLVGEFVADKVMWFDSFWDAVHTAIRPVGGALLSLAIVDPADPVWQAVALIAGGSAALGAHTAKAGTRALVNLSPEPVSNVLVSSGEDVATAGLLGAILLFPAAAVAVAIAIAGAVGFALWKLRGVVRRTAA